MQRGLSSEKWNSVSFVSFVGDVCWSCFFHNDLSFLLPILALLLVQLPFYCLLPHLQIWLTLLLNWLLPQLDRIRTTSLNDLILRTKITVKASVQPMQQSCYSAFSSKCTTQENSLTFNMHGLRVDDVTLYIHLYSTVNKFPILVMRYLLSMF